MSSAFVSISNTLERKHEATDQNVASPCLAVFCTALIIFKRMDHHHPRCQTKPAGISTSKVLAPIGLNTWAEPSVGVCFLSACKILLVQTHDATLRVPKRRPSLGISHSFSHLSRWYPPQGSDNRSNDSPQLPNSVCLPATSWNFEHVI